jgi:hypothetical protein
MLLLGLTGGCQPEGGGSDTPTGGSGGSTPPAMGGGGRGGSAPAGSGGSGGGAGSEPERRDAAGTGGNAGAGGSGGGGGAARVDAAKPRDGAAGDAPAAAPPVSGVQINIGGRMVPKEKAVVFLHIGHSDMLGRADGPAGLRPFFFDTDPNLWMYRRGGSFVPAKEPTAGDTPSAGPGMALLKTALALAPDATFISIGHGHSGADGGHCQNFRKGRNLWNTFMPAAIELKGKVTFGGVFTMFGITEYRNGEAGLSGLADCLVGLAADVRAELGDPNIPLMVGDWNCCGTGIYAPNSSNGNRLRPQIQMVPGRDMRSAIIPTNNLPMEDDRHLNMAGHKMWAERGLKILMDKGWAPWLAR